MAQKDLDELAPGERSLRNPRRRTRPDSESIKVAPRRKRSKISENTFLPRDTPEETGEEIVVANGTGSRQTSRSYGRNTSVSIASGDVGLAVRGPRNGVKRTTRVDASRVLTQNEHYSVKLLSSTPRELHNTHFRGSLLSSPSLALAVTRERVYFWDYNGHVGAMTAKSMDIPFHVSQHEPLPFGAFVTVTGSNDTGFLLLTASSGKIVYYESVDRATSLGLLQDRKHGIEGAVPSLFSGEKVAQLTDAGASGFVALLTSGRVFHIALRDSQGKPHIQTQFLYTNEQTSNGLFGSLKNIFGAGSWKQSVSALKTRALERGHAQVVGLLERGELRIWNIDWNGHYQFTSSIDFREQIQPELRQMRAVERQGDVDHLALLDLAILDKRQSSKSSELATIGAVKPMDAVLLARCGSAGMYTYCLIEFTLFEDDFSIVRILDVYLQAGNASTHQAQLLIPVPHTALIMLSDAAAIVSLASSDLNPEAQLHEASYIEPLPYQDSIYLKTNHSYKFIGGDVDHSRGSDAASLLFVDNVGLVRITIVETHAESALGEAAVRSKIEQAVFYGYQDGNILDLLRRGHIVPAEEDIEAAVLAISNDIIQSMPPHFDVPPISISANLAKRSAAASHLAAYVQKLHPNIDKRVRWHLLMNAEKIAAGVKLWHHFENQSRATKSKRDDTLLGEVCDALQKRRGFESLWPQPTTDNAVRSFFTTQLEHIGHLPPWSRSVLNELYASQSISSAGQLELVSEADDIWLLCLETALNFRKDNASQYGIHLSLTDSDIYVDDALREAPELWTSTPELIKDIPKFTDLTRAILTNVFEEEQVSPEGLVDKIASENAALVDLMCQINLERIAWCESRDEPKLANVGRKLKDALPDLRYKEIRQLSEVGQTKAGIALAEKYRDMKTLTETLLGEAQFLASNLELVGPIEANAIQEQLDAINKKVASCFERFGDAFGEAFFSEGFYDGNAGRLLSEDTPWQGHMNKWLRKYPDRAKVCWINDVLRENDYTHASKCLYDVAFKQEDNTWSKKVEVSLAKLTMHAAQEESKDLSSTDLLASDNELDAALSTADVQDRLYQHVLPQVLQSLDEETAIQDAMNGLCCTLLAFRTWHAIVSDHMAKLLAHHTLQIEELIDLLTLADTASTNIEDQDAFRSETFEALVALAAASRQLSPEKMSLMTKLAWKRAFLREDWEAINLHSESESEQDMQAILRTTSVYKAIWSVSQTQKMEPDCAMAILEPAATTGAGCHVGDIPAYIAHDLRESVLEENNIMEVQLDAMIKEQHIGHWIERIIALAKDDDSLSKSMNGHVNGVTNIKMEETDIEPSTTNIDRSDIEML